MKQKGFLVVFVLGSSFVVSMAALRAGSGMFLSKNSKHPRMLKHELRHSDGKVHDKEGNCEMRNFVVSVQCSGNRISC